MNNCSDHNKDVAGIDDMKVLAELIGDLHYESLDSLLDNLAVKIHIDGRNDFDEGRPNLGIALQNSALYLQKARQYMRQAWEISKPFMEENKEVAGFESTDPIELLKKLIADAFPPTNGPTVYGVFVRNQMYESGAEHLLYIGSSMQPENRRNSSRHPYRICYDRFPEHLVFFKCFQFENYQEVERILIKHYKPLFNKQNK